MHKEKLNFLIKRSEALYKSYLSNRVYVRALMIKNSNREIITMLTQEGHLFKEHESVNSLLDHLEVWLYQFENLERQQPQLQDEFVFERIEQGSPFPKQAVENLIK